MTKSEVETKEIVGPKGDSAAISNSVAVCTDCGQMGIYGQDIKTCSKCGKMSLSVIEKRLR